MGEEEQRLAAYVEKVTGGKVVSIDRQSRWRPAWFIKAELDGQPLSLYARGMTTREIQGAAIFLASPASSYVTGTQIVVDGGVLLGPGFRS